MADPGIKKVIFTQDQLNTLSTGATTTLRYRIVSEDKTRISAWSPIYTLPHRAITSVPGYQNISLSTNRTNHVLTVTWKITTLPTPGFDIYAQFAGDSSYLYIGSTASTVPAGYTADHYTFTYPDPNNAITSIKIQPTTTTKAIYPDLVLDTKAVV